MDSGLAWGGRRTGRHNHRHTLTDSPISGEMNFLKWGVPWAKGWISPSGSWDGGGWWPKCPREPPSPHGYGPEPTYMYGGVRVYMRLLA